MGLAKGVASDKYVLASPAAVDVARSDHTFTGSPIDLKIGSCHH
jgi:hypothetical protein